MSFSLEQFDTENSERLSYLHYNSNVVYHFVTASHSIDLGNILIKLVYISLFGQRSNHNNNKNNKNCQ